MISNRCARKSLVTNCNSIISKNYSRFLVDSNDKLYETSVRSDLQYKGIVGSQLLIPARSVVTLVGVE